MDITTEINARHAPCQPKTVELHLRADAELPKRFGQRIKAVGGGYSKCRGHTDKRFVKVPINEIELINELITTFPDYRSTTVIFRGMSVRLGNASSAVTVHSVPEGETIAVAWQAFVVALRNEIVQKALDEHYESQARREAGTTRQVEIEAEAANVSTCGAMQGIVGELVRQGYSSDEIVTIVARAARILREGN